MRILATCSLGGAGHWNPLADFVRSSTGSADQVLVVAPPALRAMVEHSGFEFAEGGEPPESAVAPIRERLATEPPEVASVLGNRELFGRLATTAMHPYVEDATERWRPELVLRDPCEYSAAVVAGQRGIPCAQIGISLAEVEWGSLIVASSALEEHRTGLTAEVAAAPYATRFPAILDPSPFAATHRYRPPTMPVADPLPRWWTCAGPLVYVTFGTVFPHMSFAPDGYRLVLSALAELPARVLLTVGTSFAIDRLGTIPANAHVEHWVDQRRVLAEADAVVCHGGSGTVLGAIAARVAIVVVPTFSDQHANARLLERHLLGVEVVLQRQADRRSPVFGDQDAAAISRAVESVFDDRDRYDGFDAITADVAQSPTAREVLRGLIDAA